jgi:hypothetical protein
MTMGFTWDDCVMRVGCKWDSHGMQVGLVKV